MTTPPDLFGSVPRLTTLQSTLDSLATRRVNSEELNKLIDVAVKDTLAEFEATCSPVITDCEQTKSSFATYPSDNLTNLAHKRVLGLSSVDYLRQPFRAFYERTLG